MLDTLKELLASKKALATICGVLVVILSPVVGWFGYDIDNTKLELIVGAVASYVVGQGVADHGATAAAIHAESRAVTRPDVSVPTVTNTIEVSK